MNKLYTVMLQFSDHLTGIGQYETESPVNALQKFIESDESLKEYDRELLLRSILPLLHYSGVRGLWNFSFNPDVQTETIKWPNDNPALGGFIVQTDINAPARMK